MSPIIGLTDGNENAFIHLHGFARQLSAAILFACL
jgi:hypothetical protein